MSKWFLLKKKGGVPVNGIIALLKFVGSILLGIFILGFFLVNAGVDVSAALVIGTLIFIGFVVFAAVSIKNGTWE